MIEEQVIWKNGVLRTAEETNNSCKGWDQRCQFSLQIQKS